MDCSGSGSGSVSIKAFVAMWTCGNVISGFFPPQPLRLTCEKQMADLRNQQMTFQCRITPHLEVRQPQFAFFVLQTALDGPAPERHMQDRRERNARSRIAEKVFDLVGIEHVPRDHQPVWSHDAVRARHPARRNLISHTIGPLSVSLM